MATPTTPASTSAAPAPQGTIVFVQGEAYLRDRQGKLQAIKPGDAVAEGQEIVTAAGAVVDVQQRALGALEQDLAAGLVGLVQHPPGRLGVGQDARRQRHHGRTGL